MVSGLNAVEIAVGGVSGAAFGSIFEGITELVRNAVEFTTSHTNIKSTLEVLQPLIQEIEGKNNTLLLQDEELRDLKEEMEEGVKRVQKLSEESVLNYCMRPYYNMELDGMDKSLKRLLRILQVQGVRDVKQALVQVNKVSSQLNEVSSQLNEVSSQLDYYKTGTICGISGWAGLTTSRFEQLESTELETLNLARRILDRSEWIGSFVPISEEVASLVEEEALRSSLLRMHRSVDEAWSKLNPNLYPIVLPHTYLIGLRLQELKECISKILARDAAKKGCALSKVDDDVGNPKCFMSFDEVNTLRIKVEEGTKLIRKCSNVDVWTDHKMDKYASKLDDLAKYLEASAQRLKRTNSTMPKGFDTQNSRLHFCSPPISVPCIKSSIDCC